MCVVVKEEGYYHNGTQHDCTFLIRKLSLFVVLYIVVYNHHSPPTARSILFVKILGQDILSSR